MRYSFNILSEDGGALLVKIDIRYSFHILSEDGNELVFSGGCYKHKSSAQRAMNKWLTKVDGDGAGYLGYVYRQPRWED